MTIYYVDSNAVGLDDGSSWANAYATWVQALDNPAFTIDDTVYIASDHSEVMTTLDTFIFPEGTSVYSVNKANDQYLKGCLIDHDFLTVEDQAWFIETNGGIAGVSGIDFYNRGDLTFTGSRVNHNIRDSKIALISEYTTGNTGQHVNAVNSAIMLGGVLLSNSGLFRFKDCTYYDGATAQALTTSSRIATGGNNGGAVISDGVDYANILNNGAPTYALDILNTSDGMGLVLLKNCTFPDQFNLIGPSVISPQYYVEASGSLATGVPYYGVAAPLGQIESDTTTYLNSTYDGVNGISMVIDTNFDTATSRVFDADIVAKSDIDLTTAKTVTVEFTCAATLTDTEFWFDVYYAQLGKPNFLLATSGRGSDFLGAGTTHTVSAAAWTAGLTNTYSQAITLPTVAGITKGTIKVVACCAKVNETINVDMSPVIT